MFDKAFILDRITECQKLINFHVNRDFALVEDFDLLFRALDSYAVWLNHADQSDEFSQTEVLSIAADRLELQRLVLAACQVRVHVQVKPVSQPAAPKQLQVFRVLGQVAKATFPKLSISWTLNQPQAKQLFPNTRPVGGLA
ncbi:MAG: hypothetical protein RBR82_00585 [Pseudomonas sp.]|nr:hypothetical protein [Pseudomonas sp.]